MGNSRKVFGWGIGGGFWCLSAIDAARFITFWPCLLYNRQLRLTAVTDQTPDNKNYGFGFFKLRKNNHEPVKWRHNGSLGGIKADMRFDSGTNISGVELWNSDHPHRKDTIKIADRFMTSLLKNSTIKYTEDLWSIYGLSEGSQLYTSLYA